MLQVLNEFKIGRPQIFAGLLLLAFLAQCAWVAASRKFSDLEFQYIASGLSSKPGQTVHVSSPFTGLVAALPLRAVSALRKIAPSGINAALAIPRPWLVRLPFIMFGLWLGAAIWWVARRLFGDSGGYIALALYCFSSAMVMVSSNIGPEIILAWSSFGLIYTAIGVAHTLYAPPRKWLPRIAILGTAIGICLATTLWSFTVVLLGFAFMLYLTPGRRRQAFLVLAGASLIGLAVLGITSWLVEDPLPGSLTLITPQLTMGVIGNLGFVFVADYYVLAVLMVAALTVYGSWPRARYFGNTAPLLASFLIVLLVGMVPAIHMWSAVLGLTFVFVFIGGVSADLLETPEARTVSRILAASLFLKGVLGVRLLGGWIHQIPM
jgi:hypothetical protein